MSNYFDFEKFSSRHIGPSENDINDMLKVTGVNTLDELINETIPVNIRLEKPIKLDEPLSEYHFLKKIKSIADKNKFFK